MDKYVLLAMTNVVEGKDEEFNDWYDNVAYPTYRALPGLVPLGRFKVVDLPKMFDFQMDKQFEYLSLYWFETDDPVAFLENLKAAFPDFEDYYFSPAIDQGKFFEPVFKAIGEVNFEPKDRYEHLKKR